MKAHRKAALLLLLTLALNCIMPPTYNLFLAAKYLGRHGSEEVQGLALGKRESLSWLCPFELGCPLLPLKCEHVKNAR